MLDGAREGRLFQDAGRRIGNAVVVQAADGGALGQYLWRRTGRLWRVDLEGVDGCGSDDVYQDVIIAGAGTPRYVGDVNA